MCVTWLFCAVIFLAASFYFSKKKKSENYPKGPRGIPIIGNVHQLGAVPHEGFAKLRDEYGDIFSIKLGSLRAIVLHDAKDIQEAFSRDVFTGRPTFVHFREQESGLQRGIIFAKGDVWEEQRRFAVRTLSHFGLKKGSRNMETLIHEEVGILINEFVACTGKPIQTYRKFAVAVVNALWILINGKRFEHNDPKVDYMLKEFYKITTNPKSQGALVFFPGFAQRFPNLSGFNRHFQLMRPIHDMINSCITSHKQDYQEGRKLDLIECFLEEMEKDHQDKLSFIGKDGDANLMTSVHDLFVAGVETTTTTLTWITLLMGHYPEIQEKVHEEISQVVGTGRLPSLEDRSRMPYCEAVILETLRFVSVVPLGVFHSTNRDVEFRGYEIPKDTLIIANLWFVDHDPRIWGDPEDFKPERFLSDDGNSVVRHDASIPFSIGKRACPGEALARDELFLFATSIFQRFEIGFVPGKPIPELKSFPGAALNIALPHEIQMRDRFEGVGSPQ